MKLLIVFARAYPLSSGLMLLGLISAALAEGIGITTLLPFFKLAGAAGTGALVEAGPESGLSGEVESQVVRFLASMGIEPTMGALLSFVVCVMFLKAGLVITAKRQVGNTVARSAMDLRLRLLKGLMAARWRYFTNQKMGIVTNAFATEAERASNAYLYATTVMSLLINAALYSAVALMVSWEVTVAGFVTAAIGMLILAFLVRATRKAGAKQTLLMRSVLARLTDTLNALEPLKAMAREDRIAPLLEKETLSLNHAARKKVLATEALAAIQEPLIITSLALGFWACISIMEMPLSRVIVMALVFGKILHGLAKAQRHHQKFTTEESAYWSMEETIARAEAELELNPGSERPVLKRSIRLQDVDLAFDDHVVFKGANLEIPAGEITALIGPSGSGKTTLSDLVIGLTLPDRGDVLVDDLPLSKVDSRAWRRQIGYVPQEMFLLNDTIRINVTLGDKQLDDDKVERALKRAGAWNFVSRAAGGLDALVGERGALLSGGQRQRIAIARALVHEPTLLILDEATTALDPKTESDLWKSLIELRGQITILAVSHQSKLSEIADRIYWVGDHVISLQSGTDPGTRNTPELTANLSSG
jgi:ATP-binding cassette subfamily C protein